MKLRIKDEDEEHIVECDNYRYLVDEKSIHLYNGEPEELIAAYNNIKWFKQDDSDTKPRKNK